ncbi:MAG: hypothetical protein U1E22_10405 [Coriobacteriia bacterium]|nr:hypothetical protein [Coriobacteriia bacterium]
MWDAESLSQLATVAREVQLVTTTTREMVERLKPYARRTRILPNVLPDKHWPKSPKRLPAPGGRLTIGWAGSIEHGVNGRLAKNTKDWLRFLRTLVREQEARERIGTAARQFAETRLASGNVHLWQKAYGISLQAG